VTIGPLYPVGDGSLCAPAPIHVSRPSIPYARGSALVPPTPITASKLRARTLPMQSANPKTPSGNKDDVLALREIAWSRVAERGYIIDPGALKLNDEDEVFSAFRVAGMDLGVPPVVVVDSSRLGPARP
jgi:hypothetical protein